MKSIATLGGGSLHRITGEAGPAAVARDLLAELTQPATRILKVEFPGLMTARVYPEDFRVCRPARSRSCWDATCPTPTTPRREVVVTAQRGSRDVRMRRRCRSRRPQKATRSSRACGRACTWMRSWSRAVRRRSRTRSSPCRKSTTSSRPTRRCWCWRRTPIASGSRSSGGFRCATASGSSPGHEQVNYELMQQQMRQAGDWRIRLRMAVSRSCRRWGGSLDVERYGWTETSRLSSRGAWRRTGRVVDASGTASVVPSVSASIISGNDTVDDECHDAGRFTPRGRGVASGPPTVGTASR